MDDKTVTRFLPLMREYRDQHIVFMSPATRQRFCIGDVDSKGCSVRRLDSDAPASATESAYRRKLAWLREQGGTATRKAFESTVAIQQCFLQMPDIGMEAGNKTVIAFEADRQRADNFIELLHVIRAPTLYKPAILTLVIEAIRDGELTNNHIGFDWLLPRFIARMQELGHSVGAQQLAEGFGRMAGDLFWLLAHRDLGVPFDIKSPTPARIRSQISHARLQEAYWLMLQDEQCRSRVLNAIAQKWWPEQETATGRRYWLIAPGENAKLWDHWQAESVVTTGWPEFGDLSQYPSLDQITELAGSEAAARMLWQFRHDIRPGDIVFAKKGRSQICGWGVITGGYQYNEEGQPHVSQRPTDWNNVTRHALPQDLVLPMQTLTRMDDNTKFLREMNGAYEGIPGLESMDMATTQGPHKDAGLVPESNLAKATTKLIAAIESAGFIFQPWQIATYIAALRTKPFVILAGVSGTGKSKLPALIAQLTTGHVERVSVRPDWTDSSDVLGYVDLQDNFRPGVVLQAARDASTDPERFHVCLLDEMNLARVEHYFAEVLSSIEDRLPAKSGGYTTTPLIAQRLPDKSEQWQVQPLPPNLGIVGTVNMDESAHGFSRKVLDRAFTLELSEVDLALRPSDAADVETVYWPPSFWHCRATRIAECDQTDNVFKQAADRAIAVLQEVNQSLVHSQLQVGYRTRDEVILFLINADEVRGSFVTREGDAVEPLDLALMMKVLPRLVGGSNAIRRTLSGLLNTVHGSVNTDEADALVDNWISAGRPDTIANAAYPRTAARLCLMWERLDTEGYTSFWL